MERKDFEELSSQLTYKLEFITPEVAAEYLVCNTRNRGKKSAPLKNYIKDMENGNWEFNGASNIVFDSDGVLRDGQHRLEAIVRSGVSQAYIVVRGIDTNTYGTMDKGSKRTLADDLKDQGIVDSSRQAAMVTTYFQMHTEHIGTMVSGSSVLCGTPKERINYCKEHDEHMQFIGKKASAYYHKNKDIFSKGDLCGIYYYLVVDKGFDFEYIEKFLYALYCGCSQKYDYINRLRNYINEGKDPTKNVSAEEKFYGVVKAFNAFFTGKNIKTAWSPKRDRYPNFISFKDVTIDLEEL